MSIFLEVKKMFRLAFPITCGQLARVAMTVIDVMMAGRYSTLDLAGVSLGSSIWFPIFILTYGVVIVLTVETSKLNAEGDAEGIGSCLRNYLFLSMALSLIVVLLLVFLLPLIRYLDLNEHTKEVCRFYIIAMLTGIPGLLIFSVFRSFMQGLGESKFPMYVSILSLLVNIPLNYVLIYGTQFTPEFGGVGAGIATAIVNTLSAVIIFVYCKRHKKYKDYCKKLFTLPKANALWAGFYIGVPSGLALFVEIVFIDSLILFVSPLGENVISAHNIMLNITLVIYTFFSGFSSAATIRISHLIGMKDRAKVISFSGNYIFVIALISIIIGIVLYQYSEQLISFYTSDNIVLSISSTLILFVCLFQFFDAIQSILTGILRGHNNMKAIFYAPLVGYWVIGLPVGLVLGLTNWFYEGLGVKGFWIGLVLGLATNAVLLFWLLKKEHSILSPPN